MPDSIQHLRVRRQFQSMSLPKKLSFKSNLSVQTCFMSKIIFGPMNPWIYSIGGIAGIAEGSKSTSVTYDRPFFGVLPWESSKPEYNSYSLEFSGIMVYKAPAKGCTSFWYQSSVCWSSFLSSSTTSSAHWKAFRSKYSSIFLSCAIEWFSAAIWHNLFLELHYFSRMFVFVTANLPLNVFGACFEE